MITENVKNILEELPEGVQLVAAAKSRTPEEILEAVEAGVNLIGENYVQEALEAFNLIQHKAKWHFIGHLQKNKVITIGIQVSELNNWSNLLEELTLDEELERKMGSIIYFKIGKDYQVELHSQLKAMLNAIKNNLS